MNDKLLLFKVTLDSVDYDTYDSALIGCRSESELRESIENGVLSYENWWNDEVTEPIQYLQKFYIKGDQSIESLQLVGVTDSEFKYDVNKRIIIILSSYNAG